MHSPGYVALRRTGCCTPSTDRVTARIHASPKKRKSAHLSV